MRKASQDDKNLVVEILTNSFKDNKSVNYVLRKNGVRVKLIRYLMAYSFNIGMRYGDIFISDNNKACSIIMLKNKPSLYSIYQDICLVINVIGLRKLLIVLKKEKDVKSHHPQGDFAHLWYIGVFEKNQGKKIGSTLLKEIIDHYKNEGLSIYLETSTEINIPFYEKNGFQVFSVNKDYGFNFYYLKN